MKVHKKDDGMRTRLQWMKEGFRIKKGEKGLLLWVNQNCPFTAEFYSRNQVQRSSKSAKDYREYIKKQRHERYVIWKEKQPDLPIPADAFTRCSIPDYFGCSADCKPVGKTVMIVDTETSGLNELWNSMLQLSWQVVDVETWQVLSEHSLYFKWPANKERVSPKAIAVNGLTAGRLEELGTTHLVVALYMLYQDVKSCSQLVGHNISFDMDFILHAVYTLREKSKFSFLNELVDAISNIPHYCTMRETLNLCCILSEKGVQGSPYKYPKLSELAQFLQINFSDLSLHNSSDDVEMTKRCYRKLMENHCPGIKTNTA